MYVLATMSGETESKNYSVARARPDDDHTMKSLLPLFLLIAALGGCRSMTYDLNSKPAVPLASSKAPYTRSVVADGWSHYLFWGLLPISSFDVNAELLLQIRKGGQNETVGVVRVDEATSFTTGLITLLTVGFYRPRDISLSANLHRGNP